MGRCGVARPEGLDRAREGRGERENRPNHKSAKHYDPLSHSGCGRSGSSSGNSRLNTSPASTYSVTGELSITNTMPMRTLPTITMGHAVGTDFA